MEKMDVIKKVTEGSIREDKVLVRLHPIKEYTVTFSRVSVEYFLK
jgi:hypothetical protein